MQAMDGIWNMLFSTYSHTFKRRRSNSLFFSRVCLSSRGSGFCILFELFVSFAQLFVVDDDLCTVVSEEAAASGILVGVRCWARNL